MGWAFQFVGPQSKLGRGPIPAVPTEYQPYQLSWYTNFDGWFWYKILSTNLKLVGTWYWKI